MFKYSYETKSHMKGLPYILSGIAVLVLIVTLVVVSARERNGENTDSPISGDVQKIVLSYKNGNYYPQEIRVKAGKPVQISLDSSVSGCYRSFTIRQLGVAKYLKTPSDSVTFTPTKSGIYTFACSMGMGTGKLIVE